MKEHNTSTIAKEFNIHPNTVRFYEKIGFLPQIPRKENGYRLYNDEDIKRLKIISSLRCANYSLSAILRLLKQLDENKNIHVQEVLNIPKKDEDIVSACDKLLLSLKNAEIDCIKMTKQIEKMKKINPPV